MRGAESGLRSLISRLPAIAQPSWNDSPEDEIRKLQEGQPVGFPRNGIRLCLLRNSHASVRLWYAGGDIRHYVPEFSPRSLVGRALRSRSSRSTRSISWRDCMTLLSAGCSF